MIKITDEFEDLDLELTNTNHDYTRRLTNCKTLLNRLHKLTTKELKTFYNQRPYYDTIELYSKVYYILVSVTKDIFKLNIDTWCTDYQDNYVTEEELHISTMYISDTISRYIEYMLENAKLNVREESTIWGNIRLFHPAAT